jgi:stage V sporulation protein AC
MLSATTFNFNFRSIPVKLSVKEYDRLAKKHSPNSKLSVNVLKAFLIGGAICTIGEVFRSWYLFMGQKPDTAGLYTSMTLILCSAVLTGFGLYDKLAKHGGAGTLVPITGFANSVVAPALEFKTEGYILGIGAKMFVIAGPVLVYGTAAAVIYGILLFIGKAL